ncbi:uncharacterized protein METZ01_LOCUS468291 [marine metagenome]|uniref:Uncharacterized protein n=1 Tax=marine metagenome TaxID=408172 RepID=A0A383B5Q0_9ZZZZ
MMIDSLELKTTSLKSDVLTLTGPYRPPPKGRATASTFRPRL